MKAHSCGDKNSNGRSWRFGLALCAALAMAAAIGMAAPGTAQAARTIVLTVRNGSDSGPGSLRRAITVANNNPAARGGITIDFDLGSSTITLESPLPEIEHRLTIDGGGTIAISGNNAYRVMSVASGATLELDNLTIQDGYNNATGGAGVLNNGTLTANNSTFSGNTATNYEASGGGIANFGTLTVRNSTFSGNRSLGNTIQGIGGDGGGIANFGRLTVTNSTFSGNTANVFGGGIFNDHGIVTVTNSSFAGNSVRARGGGIFNSAGTVTVTNSTFAGNSTGLGGGGIWNSNEGRLTVTNSTFSGNSASSGGGIFNSAGTVTVTNSTFAGNSADSGGGIYNSDYATPATVSNSIFSGNSAYSGLGSDCYGEVTGNGYNFAKNLSGCGFAIGQFYRGPLFSGGLADNGGPTETIALAPGTSNPAIDAVPADLCPSTDQRGYARRDDHEHFCDIGAYESGATGGELRIESSAGNFELKAAVGFDGPIHPLTQEVTLRIGSYSLRIPAGRFLQNNGVYIAYVSALQTLVRVRIRPATDTLLANGTDPELSGIITNPVTVTLTIGTAVSHTSVAANIN